MNVPEGLGRSSGQLFCVYLLLVRVFIGLYYVLAHLCFGLLVCLFLSSDQPCSALFLTLSFLKGTNHNGVLYSDCECTAGFCSGKMLTSVFFSFCPVSRTCEHWVCFTEHGVSDWCFTALLMLIRNSCVQL